MSTQDVMLTLGSSYTASADLSAKQFRAVKGSGAHTVTFGSAATDEILGVLQNKPVSGEAAEVAIMGGTKVEAGAAFSADTELMIDSVGRFITAVTTGNKIIARSVEAATAAGQLVQVLLYPPARRIL